MGKTKFALNYSTHAGDLVIESKIDPDLWKCPGWQGIIHTAEKTRPVYIHFEIEVGNGKFSQLDYEKIASFLATTQTPHLNCHLGAPPEMRNGSQRDRAQLLKAWVADLDRLKKRFPNVALIAENLPYFPIYPQYTLSSDSKLIGAALKETGTDLLFDLSHARISATHLGVELQAYMEPLPMESLRELHITGLKHVHGYWHDHFELVGQDWEFASWAADQIKTGAWRQPEIVAFEYGGVGDVFSWRTDRALIEEQVPRLKDLFDF